MIVLGAPIDHNVVHQVDDSWSILQDFVYLQLIVLWPGVYTEGEATVAVASKRGYEGRQELRVLREPDLLLASNLLKTFARAI